MKTLPAITAEIEADFRKNFLAEGVSSAHQFKPEVSGKLSQMFEDFIRAALLKVAEETFEATVPKKIDMTDFEQNHIAYNEIAGSNSAIHRMEANFKTFINQ